MSCSGLGWVCLGVGMFGGKYVQGVGISRRVGMFWVGRCPPPPWTWDLRRRVSTHPLPYLPLPQNWDLGYHEIRSASEQYASYWNAVLFISVFVPVSVSVSVLGNVNTRLISTNLTMILFESYKTKPNKFHPCCRTPL